MIWIGIGGLIAQVVHGQKGKDILDSVRPNILNPAQSQNTAIKKREGDFGFAIKNF
jgi:hypothetical protein